MFKFKIMIIRLQLPDPLPYSSNCDVSGRWNVQKQAQQGFFIFDNCDKIILPEGYSLFYIKPTKDILGNLIELWCRILTH